MTNQTPESECCYFVAKGMHLYVPWEKVGEACHGCGRLLDESEGTDD